MLKLVERKPIISSKLIKNSGGEIVFDVRLKMSRPLFQMITKFCDLIELAPEDFFCSALMYALNDFILDVSKPKPWYSS